jgi:hypothetical protein
MSRAWHPDRPEADWVNPPRRCGMQLFGIDFRHAGWDMQINYQRGKWLTIRRAYGLSYQKKITPPGAK